MASADLKPIMALQERHGPTGRMWFDAERNGRRFVLFEGKHGWILYERLGHPVLNEPAPETVARSDAPPRTPSRKAPRRLRRELVTMGLIEAGDMIEEARHAPGL